MMKNWRASDDLDLAMRFGLNYPQGPLSWMENFELNDLKKVLQNLPSYNKLESASRYRLAEIFNEGSMMNNVYIVKANRTPFGKIGGSLASVRTDDLLAPFTKAFSK